ncbi:MAG: phosphonate ABC transporter, permease protein PhnE [Acidimicrobiia bacterium]|nr:phosphonate ABC transporter, permease protein PhnE [Acidimicrobiia bacterium]
MTTATSSTPRPSRPLRPRIFRWAITLAIVIPAIWSALGLNVSLQRLAEAPGDIWVIVRQLVPPDMSAEALQRAVPKMLESLYIAWIGTIIGAFFSFPLAFLAAKNVTPGWLSNGIRQVLNAIRAVPELLVAMVLIPVTGLGPWTGTLAIGIHSIGTLGKLSSEVIEGIDPGPVQAVASSGGTWMQRMRFAILPQVMPNIVAYWLYRFEVNIRASAVLGIVGAGGIGAELVSQLRFRDFARAGTVLFITVVVVLLVDMVSGRLRRRIISGHTEPGPIAAFRRMNVWQRGLTVAGLVIGAAVIAFVLAQLEVNLDPLA